MKNVVTLYAGLMNKKLLRITDKIFITRFIFVD